MPGTGGTDPDPARIASRSDFARELTRLRERAGLTVRGAGKAANLPGGTAGDYFTGRHLPPLDRSRLPALLRVCGVKDDDEIEAWMEALRRVRRKPGRIAAAAVAPYRGLASFQPEDAGWFYGRERLTEQLLAGLDASGPSGAIAVVGPSGSGKSSLLRAGLVPALRELGRSAAVFAPGPDPLAALAAATADDPEVLIVDQFEEIFTGRLPEGERNAFVAALFDGRAGRLAIGVRADFYAQALRNRRLAAVLETAQFIVRPMTRDELSRAIRGPAARVGLELEDGLVDMLLRDMAPAVSDGSSPAAHEAGALPLLSHALLTTWEQSNRRRLTIATYVESGGIEGAVTRSAEKVYADLDPGEQRIARQAFVRLVHVAEDTGDTRRRVAASEFTDAAAAVIDRFVGQRLITVTADSVELAHEALLEAWPRLRGWLDADRAGLRTHRRLTLAARAWLDAGRDPAGLLRGAVLAEVAEWAADSRHADDLYPREREFLEACQEQRRAEERARRLRARRGRAVTAVLVVLLLLVGTLAAVARRQQSDADRQRDAAISRQLAVVAAKLRAKDPALAAQLALAGYRSSPTSEARSSLLASYGGPAVTRVLGPPGTMQSVAVAPDRRTMATGGVDKTVRLWDLRVPGRPTALGRPLTVHRDTVFGVAFGANGTLLASGAGGGSLYLWDLTGRAPRGVPLAGPRGTVYAVTFSPDGRTLAAASADRSVHLWDVSVRGRPVPLRPLSGFSGSVQSVAFGPGGTTLAAGSADRTIRLWDMAAARPAPLGKPLTGPEKTVFAVAFAPDGRTLAAGSGEGTVRLWNTADPRRPAPLGRPLRGPEGWVNAVAFDGHRLAAGSSDGKVWLWDTTTRTAEPPLPHPGPVTGVQYLPGGALATSSADGAARIWDLPGPLLNGEGGDVFSTTFAADRRTMAVTAADNTARLWNVADPRHPVPAGPVIRDATRSAAATGAGALSPDGRTLAVGAVDGGVRLWNVGDRARPVPLPTRLTGSDQIVQGIVYRPDGRAIAVAYNDWTVRLWDLSDPRRPVAAPPLKGAANFAYQPAFSPDGTRLAYGSADNKVHLWNVADLRRPARVAPPLAAHENYAQTVAFNRDGTLLASGGADNKVILWDLRDGVRQIASLSGPSNYVYSLAFDGARPVLAAAAGDGALWLWDVGRPRSPSLLATWDASPTPLYVDAYAGDRPVLVTAGVGRAVRFWNTDTDQVIRALCATTGTPITPAEWRRHLPDHDYAPPCESS